MSDLLVEILQIIGTVPIAILILKLIFKKSIMFQFSMLTVSFALFVSLTKAIEFYEAGFWEYVITPINIAVGRITSYNVCYTKLLR